MTSPTGRRFDYGAILIAVAAAIGAGIAVFAYVARSSGIDHTAGALLVILSSLAVAAAGAIIALIGRRPAWLRVTLVVLTLLGILGTGFAAVLLHSVGLVVMMALCLVGWIVHLTTGATGRARRPAVA